MRESPPVNASGTRFAPPGCSAAMPRMRPEGHTRSHSPSFAFTPNYDWVPNTINQLGLGECTSHCDSRAAIEACSPWLGS